MKWGWITIQPTAAKNGSQQKIIQSAEKTPLVKCLKSHSIPIFLDEIWLKSPFSSLQGQSPRVSKVPETTTYILGSAGSWRFRWDDLLGVFFTWFAGIWWGFLVDFLGFEMILMGFFDGSSMGIFFWGGSSQEPWKNMGAPHWGASGTWICGWHGVITHLRFVGWATKYDMDDMDESFITEDVPRISWWIDHIDQ